MKLYVPPENKAGSGRLRDPIPTMRATSPALEAHFGKFYAALDKGFVRLEDYMGTEELIVRAARVSYAMDTKKHVYDYKGFNGTAAECNDHYDEKGGESFDPDNEIGYLKCSVCGTDIGASNGHCLKADAGLIRYLLSHRHTSPLEMCEIVTHWKLPIHVARQVVRHRTASLNEMSGRYTQLPSEFYIPGISRIAVQSTDNKQGSGDSVAVMEAKRIQDEITTDGEAMFDRYESWLSADDLAKELARTNLPVGTYTEWYWKMDLHNLLHFLGLRLDPHAQWEVRQYADILWEMVQDWVPTVANAFIDYRLEAAQFSRVELKLVRSLTRQVSALSTTLAYLREQPDWSELTGREKKSFIAKVGLDG